MHLGWLIYCPDRYWIKPPRAKTKAQEEKLLLIVQVRFLSLRCVLYSFSFTFAHPRSIFGTALRWPRELQRQ